MITYESKPQQLTRKLAVVVSDKIEVGVAMNAIAHMALGMGSRLGVNDSLMCDFCDGSGISHPYISAYPFIVLKGRPNKIRESIELAKSQGILAIDFINTMTVGTYVEQLHRTKETANADIEIFGAVFFGEVEQVSQLTKKFSLYR